MNVVNNNNEEKQREEKRREEEKKHKEYMIKLTAKTIKITLDRYDKIQDPVTRNVLILEKMCSFFDLISAGAEVIPFTENLSYEVTQEIQSTAGRLKGHVDNLFEWVQNPVYAPDHPVGKEIKNKCEANFKECARSLEEKKN